MKPKKVKAAGIVYAVLAAAPLLLSVIFYGAYPQSVAVHWNASGEADGFAPRAVAAFAIPAVLLIIVLGVNAIAKGRAQYKWFYTSARWLAVALPVIVQGAILISNTI